MRDLSLRREAAALYMIDGRLLLYDSPPITNAWFVSLLSVLFLSVQLLSLVTLSFVNVGFEEKHVPFLHHLHQSYEHSRPHCHMEIYFTVKTQKRLIIRSCIFKRNLQLCSFHLFHSGGVKLAFAFAPCFFNKFHFTNFFYFKRYFIYYTIPFTIYLIFNFYFLI